MVNQTICICGNDKFQILKHAYYDVTEDGSLKLASNKLVIGECTKCKIIRQFDLPFATKEDFVDYYKTYPPVYSNYKIKNYKHDLELASRRLKQYKIKKTAKVLDVGSGSGAFVDACRRENIEAFGCEIVQYAYGKGNEFVYSKCFEDVYFPTDYFDVITCHDVLEHVFNLEEFVFELFRTLKQKGTCFIDYPRFFHKAGKHHWKKEHIWYFTEKQLEKYLKKVGFIVSNINYPIESKIVFKIIKPVQERIKILVPPGIGDVHWVLTKLQAFINKKKLGIPDIIVLCNKDKKHKSHIRSFPFIEMFPFVNATWETRDTRTKKEIWKEAYAQRGKTIFPKILDCDYFVSYNGILEGGYSLTDVDVDLECNWELPRFVSLEEEKFRKQAIKKYGKYIVFHWVFKGTYQNWIREFPITDVIAVIKGIIEKTGYTPIFLGAGWDKQDSVLQNIKKQIPNMVDLIGETSVEQLFGLLRGSVLMVGYPSGLAMMAASFGVKTFMLWNDWHRYPFHWNTSPDAVKNKTYFIENTKNITVEKAVEKSVEIINKVDLIKDEALVLDYQNRMYGFDRKKAVSLLNEYRIPKDAKVLDVDSKAGAFVDECRGRGIYAHGCESLEYDYQVDNKYIYSEELENINFPTDYFDWVICDETFGYKTKAVGFFQEIFRILKQGGTAILNRSSYVSSNVWFLLPDELQKEFKKIGFEIERMKSSPMAGTVFYLTKPKQERVKIVLSPGVGDVYWEITKLQAFIKREGIGIPDIHVLSKRNLNAKSHERAFPFIEMFPFLNSTGVIKNIGPKDKTAPLIWKEAYKTVGRTIFPDVLKCDYFISHNGWLANGYSLEETDPDLEVNWFPPRFVSLEEQHSEKEYVKKYGKYIVFFYTFLGSNKKLLDDISLAELITITKGIVDETGFSPVFVGAEWDSRDEVLNTLKQEVHIHVDLIGKTTIPQLFGLIKGAELVFGIPSGITILSTLLKQKTIILWSDFFHPDFAFNTSPPCVFWDTYFPQFTKDYRGVDALIELGVDVVKGIVEKGKRKLGQHKKEVVEILPKKVIVVKEKKMKRVHKSGKIQATVFCVLKSGGSFTVEYVERLKNMVSRNTTIPHRFVCLTDIYINPKVCESIMLKHGYEKWWSKIELFRDGLTDSGRVVYFDLDTVIVGNIDNILAVKEDFIGIRPWNKVNREKGMMASGMMSWKNGGSFTFLYDNFDIHQIKQYPGGDQDYITSALKNRSIQPAFWQDVIEGLYSFKRACRKKLPQDATVVCFHGNPRPHQVNKPWMKENWK